MVNRSDEVELETCFICGKPIDVGQRRISLNVYDEVFEDGEMTVHNSWNIVSYHYECSPITINKKIFEVKNGKCI